MELLEQILLHTGQTKPFRSVVEQQRTSAELRALLVSQRVNTAWRDLIKRNADIQRRLCLAPPLADSTTKLLHIKSLHMRWNNIVWIPEKGVEGIDIQEEIFGRKGVSSSRRQMLVAPRATERVHATVTIHRSPHRHTFTVRYSKDITMEQLFWNLKERYRRFDGGPVQDARLAIRQGQLNNGEELILDAFFDSGYVDGTCDEHWSEPQCKVCA